MSIEMKMKIDENGVKYYKTPSGYLSSANERLLALKRLYSNNYSIETKLEYIESLNSWHAVTTISVVYNCNSDWPETRVYTGHSCKKVDETLWGRYAAEVAETCSTSRAIGKMGIGIAFGVIASQEEVDSENTFFTPFPTEDNDDDDKSEVIMKELEQTLKRKNKQLNK